MPETPSETRFDTRSAFQQAIDTVLAAATREVCVFDPDLKSTELESRARSDRLAAFLAGDRDRSLRIVLHDTDHLRRYCPRLMGLLTRFSHCFSVRQTPESLRQVADCFVLADQAGAVIRFHADHFRGKLLLGASNDVEAWRRRFEDLWAEATPGVTPTQLGL